MKVEYPEYVHNIAELLAWFSKQLESNNGEGISKGEYPRYGGSIKKKLEKHNMSLTEFKTLLWGVMMENDKVYSPMYAFYYTGNLSRYKDIRDNLEEKKNEEEKEIEFNKDTVIEEENEEGFFDEF